MFNILFFTIFGVFMVMAPGAFLTKKNIITPGGLKDISKLLVYSIYPCLIFSSITQNFTLKGLFAAWPLPASSMMIMLSGYFIGLTVTLFIRFKKEKEKHAFLFQSTINNYSFLPIAVVAEIFEPQAVAALIFSTLGAEITVWTLGVFILTGHKVEKKSLKHLLSPPLLALYTALIWLGIFQITGASKTLYTENNSLLYYFHNTTKLIGQATIPLAMIIAGARLANMKLGNINRYTWIICGLRLLIIPLIVAFMLRFMPLTDQWRSVMLVVAVMPVSLASSMLSEIYRTDDDIVNSTVLMTHLLSLLTIPLLLAILL
ncbi:MAG: AEC family transporter [Sedimentisphaeraceae bacterium JB056]